MYIFFILFFVSLSSIAFMLGRKLVLVRGGQVMPQEHAHPFVPDLQKMKAVTKEGGKKIGYLTLVATLRFYIRFSNLLKSRYQELKLKIENSRRKKNGGGEEVVLEVKEANKFLKMISDYKGKIRDIKHKIREEEKNP